MAGCKMNVFRLAFCALALPAILFLASVWTQATQSGAAVPVRVAPKVNADRIPSQYPVPYGAPKMESVREVLNQFFPY